MSTDVVMPQMGESIAEGTIVRWIKQLGDAVDRDEPLFEISTDKVDAEISSPAEGVLTEIRAKAGDTVPINTVVAVIGQSGETAAPPTPTPPPPATRVKAAVDDDDTASARPTPVSPPADPHREGVDRETRRRQRSSPLVRRIAREHGIDLSRLSGSGLSGRVTKRDILAFIERGPAHEEVSDAVSVATTLAPPDEVPSFEAGQSTVAVPMSIMRRTIAEHMIASRRTSAHVHSVFEVDFSRVQKLRESHKTRYERAGAKLTMMAFIAKVTLDALRAMPLVNASIDGDDIIYKRDINLGIAVALDIGLIVPVIKNADEKNLLGLSRAIVDLAARARAKQLKPEEVQGGTFTITNPGGFGAIFGMPIINQPQVAILGVGTVEKRAVVVNDAIAIRPLAYLTLGFDHRLLDGVVADQFMGHVKHGLEQFEESIV